MVRAFVFVAGTFFFAYNVSKGRGKTLAFNTFTKEEFLNV